MAIHANLRSYRLLSFATLLEISLQSGHQLIGISYTLFRAIHTFACQPEVSESSRAGTVSLFQHRDLLFKGKDFWGNGSHLRHFLRLTSPRWRSPLKLRR